MRARLWRVGKRMETRRTEVRSALRPSTPERHADADGGAPDALRAGLTRRGNSERAKLKTE